MKFILSPDSFKGSLSAEEAVQAMVEGIREVVPEAEILRMPIADGGEGTLDVLYHILGGQKVYRRVPGPYGKEVDACYLLIKQTAIVELAQASGLTLTQPQERRPMQASTYGTGLLIKDALTHGVQKICLTLGGSATNDGGAGIAAAVGIRLLDKHGQEIELNCKGLEKLCMIDLTHVQSNFFQCNFTIACDVRNPLCGNQGASIIYGPQKGANAEEVVKMDKILQRYGKMIEQTSGRMVANMPGSGAAGGAAVPILAFANAKLCSGIDMVLNLMSFEKNLNNVSYVFTGEGKVDLQTGFGKAITGVIERAGKYGVPVVVFAGSLDLNGEEKFLRQVFFKMINPQGGLLQEHMVHAYQNLKGAVIDFLRESGLCQQY